MSELGIHISTQKLYDYLDKYLNPKVYSDIQPYDKERVNKANEFYSRMQEVKDDIIALEQIYNDANGFIQDSTWKDKLDFKREYEEERERMKDIGYRFSRFVNDIHNISNFDHFIYAMAITSVCWIMGFFAVIVVNASEDPGWETFNLSGWAYLIILILNILPAFLLACTIITEVEDGSGRNVFWRDFLIFVFSLVVSIPLLSILEIFVGTVAGRLFWWIGFLE